MYLAIFFDSRDVDGLKSIIYYFFSCYCFQLNKNVYFREGVIKHLWHGSRNYKKRWLCLKNFNPESDIKISEEGVFEWSCDKIDMINCCKKMCLNYDINMKI